MSEDPIKNTILTATTVSPDLSFVRYQFDEFKNTKARQVPLEEIDYSIYKSSSNCVAFTTTEERIILWIKAMYSRYYAQSLDETETNYYGQMKTCWAEQPAHNDNTKCEKITLNLSILGKKSHENIVTIFIYCSTGRIQIQGRSVRVWGDNEFNELKALVDGNSAETTRNLKKFIEIVKQPQPSTAPNEKCDNNEQSSCVEASEDASVDETQDIPTPKCLAEKDESFSTMKDTVSNLESEFISFKQETYKMFEDMSLALKEKDNKINLLQQRIISLEACSELLYKQHTNNDCLFEKQHELDKKINNALC